MEAIRVDIAGMQITCSGVHLLPSINFYETGYKFGIFAVYII